MKVTLSAVIGAMLGAVIGILVFRALDAGLVGLGDWLGLILSAVAGAVAGAVIGRRVTVPIRRHRHPAPPRAMFFVHHRAESEKQPLS